MKIIARKIRQKEKARKARDVDREKMERVKERVR